jgi:hypothetical protein
VATHLEGEQNSEVLSEYLDNVPFESSGSPVTIMYREFETTPNVVGKYGVLPTFHVTVPSLLPAGTYQ